MGAAHASTARRIDCAGDYLLPGLIELHTDNLERHLEPRPGTFWDVDLAVLSHDAELAACGITCAFDAVTLGGAVDSSVRQRVHLSAISSIEAAHAAGLLRIHHELHLRCELSSPDLPEQLERAAAMRVPRLISLMDHTPGQGQWHDIAKFREYYTRRYGLSEAQLNELIVRRQAAHERYAEANRSTVLSFAKHYDCVVAGHDAADAQDVATLSTVGCAIAEFPVSIAAARAARDKKLKIVAGAPNLVRGSSHSGNVSARELAGERLIDILSSDYCPSSLLHGVWTLVSGCGVSLTDAVHCGSTTAALTVGLSDRGSLSEGMRADLIRVRTTARGPVVVAAWCSGRQVS